MKRRGLCIVLLACALVLCISACTTEKPQVTENLQKTGAWKDAIYTEDTFFGKGEKTFELEVKADEKSVTFTINTDKDNLEDALTEHKLIDGEKGPYGLYVKKINGITADYDIDQSYWALSEDGEPLATGARGVEVKGGEHFEFTYTR